MLQSKWHVALLVLFLGVSGIAKGIQPFALPWMNGVDKKAIYRTADHPGGVFVIETYFLNCPYCNDNAESVNKLADKYKNNPRVQVLDVGIDRLDTQYAEWIRRHRPNHPVLKDAKREVVGQLGTTAYPSTYIVDCRGKVHLSHLGLWTSSKVTQIEALIDRLLAEDCKADGQ